jgi:hypothetical protein
MPLPKPHREVLLRKRCSKEPSDYGMQYFRSWASQLAGAPGRIRPRDPLLRRSVCAAGRPAYTQVSRCIGLSGSDREFPALTGRSGTQRARPLGPELAVALGVWWLSQLAAGCAAGCACWRMSGDVAVLPRCTARASSRCCPGWASPLACWCRPVSEDAASVPAAGARASDLACPRCCSGASLVGPTALQRVVEYSHSLVAEVR